MFHSQMFFTVIHDENSSHVQLDVVLRLLILEEVERSSLRDEKECSELELTFNGEMFHSQMFFPIVTQALVKFTILFGADVIGGSGPDRLGLVQFLILRIFLLDLFLLLVVTLVSIGVTVFTDIFNLWLLSLFLLVFILFLGHFLFSLLLNEKFDWIPDELRVLLHNFLDLFLLSVLRLVFLHLKNNLSTSS